MARLLSATHRFCPALSRGAARGLAASGSTSPERYREIQELREAMADAVASAEMVCPSANQLMLETDPAARGPREQYELHYAEMALLQLHQALERKELLWQQLGGDAERVFKEERLRVLAADCMLWRDRTTAVIATVRQKQGASGGTEPAD